MMQSPGKRKRRGTVLIEMLVSCMLSLIVGAGLLAILQVIAINAQVVPGQANVTAMARRPLDILVDNLRNAQVYATTPSCFQAATTNSVSIYTNTTGSYTKFWLKTDLNPYTLAKTIGSTTTILVSGLTNLQFTYYVSSNQYTPTGGTWVTTANPNAPTAAELPKIASVGISASMNVNGYDRSFKSFVRVRNSPPNVN